MSHRFSRSGSVRRRVHRWNSRPPHPSRLGLLVAVAAAAVLLFACSEEGAPLFGEGRVGVALSDSPGGDFTSAHMTVSRIELLGVGPPALLFEGLETFDLLELRDASELFSMAEDVPAGRYTGIRLFLEEIAITRLGEDGSLEAVSVELPADRKMELRPLFGIEVAGGETVVVEIDMALVKSLARVDGAEQAELAWRPACRVKILRHLVRGRLARIHGRVAKVDAETSNLLVCRTHFALSPREDRLGDHPVARRCVDVTLGEGASLFDSNGDPAEPGDVEVENEVTVFGRFRLDESQDDHRPLSLHAALVLIGKAGSFTRVRGLVASEYDADLERFDVAVAPGEPFEEGTVLAVQLQEGTKLFSRPGAPLTTDDIELGLRSRTIGVLALSDSGPDLFKAASVRLDVTPPGVESVAGELVELGPERRRLVVESEEGSACVNLTPLTEYQIAKEEEGSAVSEGIGVDDLELGQQLEVFVHPSLRFAPCYTAETVIVTAPAPSE